MIKWAFLHFTELTGTQVYEILHLRNLVFVVEQKCVYNDTDQKDLDAWHLCGYLDNSLVAHARILAPGVSYKEASIGRVVTHPYNRAKGYGKELMKIAIQETLHHFQVATIKISAQEYLLRFYESLGFKSTGKAYLEDDIPHVEMVYESGKKFM